MFPNDLTAVLSSDVRTVLRGEDALMHNIANGSWCRVSGFAARFFGKPGGVNLMKEAAAMNGDESVSMLRMASELAEAGMLVRRGMLRERRMHKVAKAYLIVTRKCNLACPACYMGEPSELDYPAGKVLEAARKVKETGASKVLITGGEPCIREDLPGIIAAMAGTQAVLCTNGTLPDRIPFGLLRSTGTGLQVSIESCYGPSHDSIRGLGCHRLAAETARKASEMGIEVQVVPTIMPDSDLDIDGMLKFAGSLGAGCHGSLMVKAGRGIKCGGHDGKRLMTAICDYLLKCVGGGEIDDSSPLEDIVPMISRTTCGAGSRIICFTGDAEMHPCHLLWDRPMESGSASEDVDAHPVCSKCDVRYLCAGGCLAAAEANGGLDPNCAAYKAVFSAFAWGWDDTLGVSENVRRLSRHDSQGDSGVPCGDEGHCSMAE